MNVKKADNIMVSVYMLTYNHVKYVEQAIKSVLMQKVNFAYELLIGDDASTDGTAEIVKKYAKMYPDIIKAYCRKQNIGAMKNGISIRSKCKGKYIATLEGDDFWNIDNKLQMQIDFLENHSDYSMCFTDVYLLKKTAESPLVCVKKDINNMKEYLNNGSDLIGIPTATVIYRNIYRENKDLCSYFTQNAIIGDRIQHTLLLQYGKLKYLPVKSATYRFIVTKGCSFSAMDEIFRMQETVKALHVCMNISEKRCRHLWRKIIANFNKKIFSSTLQNKGIIAAVRQIFFDKDIIDTCYLIRKIISE